MLSKVVLVICLFDSFQRIFAFEKLCPKGYVFIGDDDQIMSQTKHGVSYFQIDFESQYYSCYKILHETNVTFNYLGARKECLKEHGGGDLVSFENGDGEIRRFARAFDSQIDNVLTSGIKFSESRDFLWSSSNTPVFLYNTSLENERNSNLSLCLILSLRPSIMMETIPCTVSSKGIACEVRVKMVIRFTWFSNPSSSQFFFLFLSLFLLFTISATVFLRRKRVRGENETQKILHVSSPPPYTPPFMISTNDSKNNK